MTVEAIIFILIVAGVSGISIALPFLRARSDKNKGVVAKNQLIIDDLETTYERILASIRDLDEDFNIGKLDSESYRVEREMLAQQGVATLQEIDRLQGISQASAKKPKEKLETDAEVDAAIEEAIAAYRQAHKGA